MDDLLCTELERLGLAVAVEARRKLARLADELLDANQRVNLTAITDPEGIAIRHFADSLTGLLVLPPPPPDGPDLRVLDVGAGAGFPGLPLAVARPGLRLTLLEATGKKAAFLRHVVAALDLPGVEVVTGRAEDVGHDPRYRERFDVVLARAVAALPALLELTLPFAVIEGRVVAWKKADIPDEIAAAGRALTVLGGRLAEQRILRLTGDTTDRMLLVIEKVRPTPAKYPRRPGVPVKDPL